MTTVPVNILVVPDGIAPNGKARISLSVAPGRPDDTLPPTADLGSWPSAIADLANRIVIFSSELTGTVPSGAIDIVGNRVWPADLAERDHHVRATEVWKEIFPDASALEQAIGVDDLGGFDPSDPGKAFGDEVMGLGSIRSGLLSHYLEKLQLLLSSEAVGARLNAGAGNKNGLLSDEFWGEIADQAPSLRADPVSQLRGDATASLEEAKRRRFFHANPDSDAFADKFPDERRPPDELDKWIADTASATQKIAAATTLDMLRKENALVEPVVADMFVALGINELALGSGQLKTIPDHEDPPHQKAGRRLAAIASYPTLAKYLGLIIDVEIDHGLLPNGIGALAATFLKDGQTLDAAPVPTRWTAFEREGAAFFGPISRQECAAKQASLQNALAAGRERPALPQRRGLVVLGAKLVGTDAKRFSLLSVDPVKGQLALLGRAAGITDAYRSAMDANAYDRTLPDIGEIGIAMFDEAVALDETESEDPPVSFAEDLTRGVRVDCYLVPLANGASDLPEEEARWRSLMDRDIRFEISDAFLREPAVQAVSHRDEGFAQPGVVQSQTGQQDAPGEIVMWKGEGLGVSPPAPEAVFEGDSIDASNEVPISRTVGYPADPARQPPPLRLGRGYWFGARACYVNGCGPALADARRRYSTTGGVGGEDSLVLGNDRAPYVYGRKARIAAPLVMLPDTSALVRNRVRPPGETIMTMVIKTERDARQEDFRVVLPGRVSFDVAEQHGQFDDRNARMQTQPDGAFMGDLRLVMDERGDFPVARGGRVVHAPLPDPEDSTPEETTEDTRGVVAIFDEEAEPKGEFYYPDSRSRLLAAQAVLEFDNMATGWDGSVQFWAENKRPRDAAPVALRLLAARRDNDRDPVSFRRGSKRVDVVGGGRVRVNSLDVRLQPAMRAKLELFVSYDPPLEAKFDSVVSRAFSHAARQALVPLDTEKSMRTVAAGGPVATLQSVAVVEIVHAVERPLDPPVINENLSVLVGTVDPATGNPQQLTSVEGGTTAFFDGAVAIHGRSTGRLRLEGEWVEHGPEALFKSASGKWTYTPGKQSEILHKFETVKQPEDILAFGSGQASWPHFSFRDGRSRILSVEAIATSSFTDFYSGGTEGRHERASPILVSLPIPCTFRPPEPDHWQAQPVPHWKSTRSSNRREYSFELSWSVRVYLGTNYQASGDGEQMALVFWKQEENSDGSLAEYESKTVGFSSVLTQWGNDPIEFSGRLPTDLPAPAEFTDLERKTRPGTVTPGPLTLELPPPSDPAREQGGTPLAPLIVEAVPFKTKVDIDEGPVINIGIDSWRTYRPFLRLGLCRYQPNSIEGLALSHANPRTVILLPPRRGRVTVKDRKVDITMWGPGYTGRVVPRDPSYGTPLMRIRLMEYESLDLPENVANEPPLRPALDPSGRPIVAEARASYVEDGDAVFNVIGFELPRSRRVQDYALLIEEFEFFEGDPDFVWTNLPDTVVPGDPATGRGAIISRLTFQRKLDLGRYAPRADDHAADFDLLERPSIASGRFPAGSENFRGIENLQPTAKHALGILLDRYPGVVVVSGRRSVASQARAMAENLAKDPSWMRRTYRASPQRDALLAWVDGHPGASSQATAHALHDIMELWSQQERQAFSLHFSGLAIDLVPMDDPEIERFIEGLPNLRNFIRREGSLRRWHLEFNPGPTALVKQEVVEPDLTVR